MSIQSQNLRRLSRRRRQREEGMTLVEIMIVVVIMALIATGVAVALLPQLERAQIDATTQNVSALRSAVTLFKVDNPGDCPTVDDLVEGEYIDSHTETTDAWDNDFEISCDGRNFVVSSAGPDGQFGSEDDIE